MTDHQTTAAMSVASNAFGEQYLSNVNGHSISEQASEILFSNHFSDYLGQMRTLYIISGSDSGLLIRFVIKRGIPKESRFIFIEPDELLDNIMALVPELDRHPDIALCGLANWQQQAEKFQVSNYIYQEKVKLYKSHAALHIEFEPYNGLNIEIEKQFEEVKHRTLSVLAITNFISAQLENLAENQYPAKMLRDLFSGKTCLILGGGPSLSGHLEWIKQQQDHCLIIAISRIAGILIQQQITPHIVISIDQHPASFDLAKDMLALADDCLFINGNHACPKLVSQWAGRQVYLGSQLPWQNLPSGTDNTAANDTDNIATVGPTVTNTAIHTAMEMGCKRILLCGVDLCYGIDGASHAKGTPEASAGAIVYLDQEGEWLETYSGEQAMATVKLKQAIDELAGQAQQAALRQVELVNLASTAARVEGIRHQAVTDINLSGDEDIREQLQRCVGLPNRSERIEHYKLTLLAVEQQIKQLDQVLSICREALSVNKKLYKGKDSNFKYKEKLDKLQNKLDGKLTDTSSFLKHFGFNFFSQLLNTTDMDKLSNKRLEETGRVYYQAFIDSALSLKPKLQDARKKIVSRIEEHKEQPNLQSITTYWGENEEPGRAKLWIAEHPQTYSKLEQADREQLESCIKAYEQLFVTRSDHEKKVITRVSGFFPAPQTRNNIYANYRQANHAALQQIINVIALVTNDPQADSFGHLATAYLSLLQENKQQALDSFAKVQEQDLSEIDLKEIFSLTLALNQHQQAEQPLSLLCKISDLYAPQYARLLKLNGKLQESIETFTDYLNSYPKDTKTWLELGELFISIEAHDLAKMAFDYVLEQQPDNSQAINHLHAMQQPITQ